jgi:hypothetical protein
MDSLTGRMLAVFGMLINLAGVLVLFRWGMPFRVPNGGSNALLISGPTLSGIAVDQVYETLGWIGLSMTIIGTGLQIAATLLPATADQRSDSAVL